MAVKLEEMQKAERIFGDWQEPMIQACMQKIMGNVYADDQENPRAVMSILGDFCCVAGEPDQKLLLAIAKCHRKGFLIIVPQNETWGKLIAESYGVKAKAIMRHAIKKEPDIFDKTRLQRAVHSLPPEYEVKMIDEACFRSCRENEWSQDLVSQFCDYEIFEKLGIGAVVQKGSEIVSGASTYARYRNGIEIEVDTREDYRRQGLAYACAAKLILACLNRGLYPSWDAHNKESVALAEKLGYHYDYSYPAYEVWID